MHGSPFYRGLINPTYFDPVFPLVCQNTLCESKLTASFCPSVCCLNVLKLEPIAVSMSVVEKLILRVTVVLDA